MTCRRTLAYLQLLILCIFSAPAWCDEDLPPTSGNEPVVVHVSLVIHDIFDINDNNQTFSLLMSARVRWKDPRLSHEGQGNIKRKLEEIWYPNMTSLTLQKSWSYVPKYANISPSGEVVYHRNIRGTFSQHLI